ncbi:MAG: hypothetical protein A2623_12000 [Caulobacterales bacterium RIFCSPHIGHO2_01_FULL_70_19]|nr:MAG: hypothetical protein A2623_12000 [Caulobacterales bacterium RIFCSPHIGHO2_01_FULL_70_19]
MRHAEQAFGHGDRIALEGPDRPQILTVGLGHQRVERQGGSDDGDTGAGEGRALGQDGSIDPADDAVAAGLSPDPLAPALQHVEGLAEDQFVDRFGALGVAMNVGDRCSAAHRPRRPVGGGVHQPLQRLLGQIGPGESGAGIEIGGGCGQTRLVRLSRNNGPRCQKGR